MLSLREYSHAGFAVWCCAGVFDPQSLLNEFSNLRHIGVEDLCTSSNARGVVMVM